MYGERRGGVSSIRKWQTSGLYKCKKKQKSKKAKQQKKQKAKKKFAYLTKQLHFFLLLSQFKATNISKANFIIINLAIN